MEESEQYLKFKNNVLKKFLKDVKKNYKIIDNFGNEVSDETLLQLNKFNRCNGVVNTASGSFSRCTKNSNDNFNYCKLHLKKQCLQSLKSNNVRDEVDYVIIDNPSNQNLQSNLKKKFIQDSFYFIDSKYIYATDDHRKVGIIENNQYILTDDPFVLGTLF
jgi:hypothetical protein